MVFYIRENIKLLDCDSIQYVQLYESCTHRYEDQTLRASMLGLKHMYLANSANFSLFCFESDKTHLNLYSYSYASTGRTVEGITSAPFHIFNK